MTDLDTIGKLNDMVEGIDIAMFTSTAKDGSLVSRPMSTQRMDEDGHLWFFTRHDSAKLDQLNKDSTVNIGYADIGKQKYVSVSGKATVSKDREKITQLWNPILKAWFPDGPEDPDIVLIRVDADKAEYWESKGGALVQLVGFAKAIVTGDSADDLGENKKVSLKTP